MTINALSLLHMNELDVYGCDAKQCTGNNVMHSTDNSELMEAAVVAFLPSVKLALPEVFIRFMIAFSQDTVPAIYHLLGSHNPCNQRIL